MESEKREGEDPSISLKQVLLEATFKPGRVYEGPDVIDLDSLQPDVEDLIDYTVAHPMSHEAGRIIYVTHDRKILVNKDLIKGEAGRVKIVTKFTYNPYDFNRATRQNRYLGSKIHSHYIDSPFSPSDLSPILVNDFDDHAATSVLLITPVRKLLAFRGKNTPSMTFQAASEYLQNLDEAARQRMNKFIKPRMKEEEINELMIRINSAMFGQIVDKHGLQLFVGGVWDRYLDRAKDEVEAAA